MENGVIKEIGDLRQYLVKVLTPDDKVNGTGFLCHPDGYALTCYHVITPWLKQQQNEIHVIHGEQTYSATLLPDRSTEAGDIAVFQLKAEDNGRSWDHLPLDTYWRVDIGHNVESFGYPIGTHAKPSPFAESGAPISGTFGGLTPAPVDHLEAYSVVGFNLSNVDYGYSGAPLFDRTIQKVVGLIWAKHESTQSFIVSLSELFAAWPELKDLHDIYRRIREQL